MIIAVDFDRTMVMGTLEPTPLPVPHAIDCVKALINDGAKIILYTMRGNLQEAKYLDQAVKYMEDAGIELYGVNHNPDQKWTDSSKIHADFWIDDRAIGCPIDTVLKDGKPVDYYVDWPRAYYMLKRRLEYFGKTEIKDADGR